MPERVQVEGDLFGGIIPPGSIYIGLRTPRFVRSKWAHPFDIGRTTPPVWDQQIAHPRTVAARWSGQFAGIAVRTVDQAINLYRQFVDVFPEYRTAARAELRGYDLACWCPPSFRCHAEVLLVVANWPEGVPWSPLSSE